MQDYKFMLKPITITIPWDMKSNKNFNINLILTQSIFGPLSK
jgi:hypothetical protein